MNNNIQNKLLELEIQPPTGVWKSVEEELNASAGDRSWKSKLEQIEVAVPASSWNHIVSALEPAPEMDLTAKLREAAVVPPPGIWNEIEKKLSAPSVFNKGWMRYAAAAVMAGLLFSAAYFLSFSSNDKLAAVKIEKPGHALATTKGSRDTDKVPAIDQQQKDDRALEQSKRTYASVNVDRKKISRIASGFRFASADETLDKNDAPTEDINDRYIVLMTPDGNFIRVSKKLGDLVCCVSGEEEDRNCKEQVVKWQKQMASADILHAGNFGDILSMVSELQQDK